MVAVSRRAQRGNALIIGVLLFTLLLGFLGLVVDGALLYGDHSDLETSARECALAGATAIDLNGYTASGQPQLNPALASARATAAFQGLQLGPDYTFQVVQVTTEAITVRISHPHHFYLIALFWPPASSYSVSAQATAVPQIGF